MNKNIKKILDNNYLIKNTSITSFFNGLGMISGFFLDALIVYYFGFSENTDAFFAALAIPRLLSGMIENQTPKVIVPLVNKNLLRNGEEHTWQLISNFINLSLLMLLLVVCIGAILSSLLMKIQVPGLSDDTIRLSAKLCQILLLIVLFQGIGAYLRSLLFTFHKYFIPSLRKLVTNSVALIISFIWCNNIGIKALAYGLVIGELTQLLVIIIAVYFLGFRYKLILNIKDKTLRKGIKLIIFPYIDHGLSQMRVLLENFLTSFLAGGNLTALRYANRIVLSASGVLVGGIVTTSLPLISHYASEKNIEKVKESLLKSVKILMLIAFPLCTFLIFVSEPMMILLFERGKISRADIVLTSILIGLLSPYVLLSRLNSLSQIPFFAFMDTKTPLFGTIISFITNALIALFLIDLLKVYSFPIAASTSSFITCIIMIYLLHKKFGDIGFSRIRNFIFRIIGATIISGLGFKIGLFLINGKSELDLIGKLLFFLIPTILGGISFCGASMLLGVIRANNILKIFREDPQ